MRRRFCARLTRTNRLPTGTNCIRRSSHRLRPAPGGRCPHRGARRHDGGEPENGYDVPATLFARAALATVAPVHFEVAIGLEIHVQLRTASKMFCACPVVFGAPPNTLICPTCLGLPGALPVLNGRAVDLGLRTAVALSCTVPPQSQFHRKNYFYPDLPKNYQITQYRYKVHPPLATDGELWIPSGAGRRRIGIRRVHLEEDTGRLVHVERGGTVTHSLIDYNRSGVPLMEVVTEPDLRSPHEARGFVMRLLVVLQAIEVSTGRMEEGSLRGDAEVSPPRLGDYV